jgi:hypothetical protein
MVWSGLLAIQHPKEQIFCYVLMEGLQDLRAEDNMTNDAKWRQVDRWSADRALEIVWPNSVSMHGGASSWTGDEWPIGINWCVCTPASRRKAPKIMRCALELMLRNLSLHLLRFLERLQSNALRMIVESPWFVPHTLIPGDLQTPTVKEEIRRYSSPQRTPKWPNSKPHGAARQQATAKTPARWSAYQIPSAIALFVVLVFKV